MAQLNALDLAILAILALGLFYGLSRGALRMATPIVSFACGIYAGSLWYGRAGALVQRNFQTSPATSQVMGYALVFLLVFVVVGYAAGRVIELAHVINLNWIDRIAGGAFGIAIAASFAGLDVLLLTALLPTTSPLLRESQLAPRALAYNETLIGFIPPEVRQLYFEKRGQLYHFWAEKTGKLEPKSDSPK